MPRAKQPQPIVLPGLEAAFARPVRVVSPAARALCSGKAKRELPAPEPWQAVVLGVDTARRSGWAIMAAGRYCDSGELDTLDEPALLAVVRRAQLSAEQHKLPIVLVLEMPWGGSPWIVAALGQARERWLRAWKVCAESRDRVQYVQPTVWRCAVLGSFVRDMPRDEVRAVEQAVARVLVPGLRGEDEAPAVLIARWGAHARAVGKRIGVRATRKSVAAWTGGR